MGRLAALLGFVSLVGCQTLLFFGEGDAGPSPIADAGVPEPDVAAEATAKDVALATDGPSTVGPRECPNASDGALYCDDFDDYADVGGFYVPWKVDAVDAGEVLLTNAVSRSPPTSLRVRIAPSSPPDLYLRARRTLVGTWHRLRATLTLRAPEQPRVLTDEIVVGLSIDDVNSCAVFARLYWDETRLAYVVRYAEQTGAPFKFQAIQRSADAGAEPAIAMGQWGTVDMDVDFGVGVLRARVDDGPIEVMPLTLPCAFAGSGAAGTLALGFHFAPAASPERVLSYDDVVFEAW